jgi:hypothetical protein
VLARRMDLDFEAGLGMDFEIVAVLGFLPAVEEGC